MDAIENGQLVPVGRPAAAERGETSRIERFDAPAPGTYWRLRDDFKGENSHRCKCRPMPAGTVLMLASVEMADGQPHVYNFAPHPLRHKEDGPQFHAEDLLNFWEPAPDGERVRALEMQELALDMDRTRLQLTQEPPGVTPVALLGHNPVEQIGEAGRELVTVDQVQAIEAYAARIQADAEARTNWITEHSKTLGKQGMQLAAFHQERAQAQLAKASSALEGVKTILKTVENLKFYVGEDIEVIALRDGEPAPADTRVSIYQEVLAFDEETLILLDQGGLDHRHVEELSEALMDDALVRRMIPAERGIVLCQFRKTDKKFFTGDDASAAIGNAIYNEEAQTRHLLVRDGERLWLLMCPRLFGKIDQLMPSAREQGAYFRRDRWWSSTPPEEITRDDLDYASAQRKQMTALDAYGRVLIVLWGLTDREAIFAGSSLPRFSNWLDEGFQNRWLTLVSQDSMIGVTRPGFDEWQRTHNETLAPGSWIAIRTSKAFTLDYAPGAWSNSFHHKPSQIWDPLDSVLIARVKSDSQGLYVEVPCEYDGYNGKSDGSRRNIKMYVRYEKQTFSSRIPEGVLALDRVHAADLTYYLESRQQRRRYKDYVQLFQAARPWVAERDQREVHLREELRQAVAAAKLSVDPPVLEAAITESIAVARAARRDNLTPAVGSSGYVAMRTAALDLLHQHLVGNDARIAAVEAWAEANGRKNLRLSLSVQDGWQLYAVSAGDEIDPRLGEVPMVSRFQLAFDGDAAKPTFVERCMLRPRKGEQIIRDWDWTEAYKRKSGTYVEKGTREAGAKHFLHEAPPFEVSYAEAVRRVDHLLAGSAGFRDIVGDRELIDLIEAARRWTRQHSKGSVQRADIIVPIGTGYGDVHGRKAPFIVVAHADAWGYAYKHGNDAKKVRVEAALGIYRHPESHIEALPRMGGWRIGAIPIDQAVQTEAWWLDTPTYHLDAEVFMPKAKASKSYRLTSLNDAGARLLPELISVAERAA